MNRVRGAERKPGRARWRSRCLPVLAGLAGALILLIGDRWADVGLWTFTFLRYVGWRWRLGLAAVVLAAGVPLVQEWLVRLWRVRPSLSRWLLIPGGAGLFWFLREQTWRGDALLKLHLLETQTLGSDPYVWKEPLDACLTYGLTAWLTPLGVGPETVVAILSVTAGVVYLIAILEASYYLGLDATGRALIVVSLLGLGSSQLWFGHVENYSLVTAFSMLAVAVALGYLAGQRTLWAVGLTTGAAISLHPQAVFVAPALLVLLRRREWPRQAGVLAASGAIVPVLTVAALRLSGARWPFTGPGYAGDRQLFWTLGQALVPSRLTDALSNLWLVVPLLPELLAAVLVALLTPALHALVPTRVLRGKERTASRRFLHSPPHSSVFVRVPFSGLRDRRFFYLSVLALGLLAYHFTFQNDLPRPWDWDLFAIVGPGVTLWGVYTWLRSTKRTSSERAKLTRRLLLPGLAFALSVTGAWVGVNHMYTLIRPDADQRELFARYRLADLLAMLPRATVTPAEPFCADPASDPTGCRRVTETVFTMPQDGDARPVIFAHAPAQIALRLEVPSTASFLWLSPALDPLAWGWGGDGVTFQVRVLDGGRDDLLWERHLTPANPADLDWQELFLPLDAYAGRSVTLLLVTTPGPAGDAAADRAGWGMPWLMRGTVDMD